jgi:hypothetical protein
MKSMSRILFAWPRLIQRGSKKFVKQDEIRLPMQKFQCMPAVTRLFDLHCMRMRKCLVDLP